MSRRPTLKLKADATPRDPRRSRVRATTAPRSAAVAPRDTVATARRATRDEPKHEANREPSRPPNRPPKPAPKSAALATPHAPRRAESGAAPASPRDKQRRPLAPARPVTAGTPRAQTRPRPVEVQAHAEGIRLSKALTEQGIASRREADDWIAAGWVRVDGQMAVLGQRVRPEQRIDIDPLARREQARSVTILLNKPVGHVSGQAEDGYPAAAELVTEANRWADEKRPFHPGHARGLAPAGRLDIDSTGLLVLTQDGRVARQLIGEDSGMEKEYLVRVSFGDVVSEVQRVFPAAQLARLRHGLSLDDQALKPAQVDWQNAEQLRFVLTEGKKRQIRRMCEQVGLKVVGLKRVRIGRVVLGQLPVGQWRYLAPQERF
jgi:23S rRNA pseudouridine2604 synthase